MLLSLAFAFQLAISASSAEEAAASPEALATWNALAPYVENPSDPSECPAPRNYLEAGVKETLKDYYREAPPPRPAHLYYPTEKRSNANEAVCVALDPLEAPESTSLGDVLKRPFDVRPRDVACVAIAQRDFGLSGWGYTECKARKGKDAKATFQKIAHPTQRFKAAPSKNPAQPCRSLEHAKLVAQSFKNMAACLGANPRQLFKLFAKESGFVLNATSFSGAVGIGQITDIALRQVRNVDEGLPYGSDQYARALARKFRENITGSPERKPLAVCDPLHEFETRVPAEGLGKNACSLLSFPEAAFSSMLNGMKLYLYYRADIAGWSEAEGLRAKFGKDYEEILDTVAAYSYSAAGFSTTLPVFKALARTRYTDKNRFLGELKARLIHRVPRRAGEIRNYVSGGGRGMEDRYSAIREELKGGECF